MAIPEISPGVNELENDMLNYVLDVCKEAQNEREKNKFDEEIKNSEDRFKAMRSIRGLDYNELPKTSPWPGCSDVGIPIDAITIQSLVSRIDRVEFERLPLTKVTAVGSKDIPYAPKIEAFLDWQKLNLMRIRIPKLMSTRKALTVGSHFIKVVFEDDYVWQEEDIFGLSDPDGGGLLKDEEGVAVEWNPDEPMPTNDNLRAYQIVQITRDKKVPTYRGPKFYSRDPRQILWASTETSPDPSEWDWWCDTYKRSIEWLENNGEEQGFKNIDQITSIASSVAVRNGTKFDKRKEVDIWEWHGRYKVNGKNKWVVVAVAPQYRVFMGYRRDKIREKTGTTRLVHRCPIPMDGQVIGMSIPKFIKGLRDAIDAIFNQMIDRGSRTNNPPIIYSHGSGFDPSKHNFGYRFWPEKVPGTIRELPMGTKDNIEIAKIELLIGLIQRLFGVTDTTSGVENPNNKTYGGITTLLAEGNVNIDMIIQTLGESNIALDELIIAINCIYARRDENGKVIPIEIPIMDEYSNVMEDPDNPFLSITEEELMGSYNYIPTGTSLNINTRSLREEAIFLYDKVIMTQQANPYVQDMGLLHELTLDLFKSFGKKNIKVPTQQEIEQKIAMQQQQQMQMMQAQQQAQQQAEQQKHTMQAQTDQRKAELDIQKEVIKNAGKARQR